MFSVFFQFRTGRVRVNASCLKSADKLIIKYILIDSRIEIHNKIHVRWPPTTMPYFLWILKTEFESRSKHIVSTENSMYKYTQQLRKSLKNANFFSHSHFHSHIYSQYSHCAGLKVFRSRYTYGGSARNYFIGRIQRRRKCFCFFIIFFCSFAFCSLLLLIHFRLAVMNFSANTWLPIKTALIHTYKHACFFFSFIFLFFFYYIRMVILSDL